MLKGVFGLGEETRFVEKFGRLQAVQGTLQVVLGKLCDVLQQHIGHVRTNHRSTLQELFGAGRQSIDTGRQQRMYRGRNLHGVHIVHQPIRAGLSCEGIGLHQGAN